MWLVSAFAIVTLAIVIVNCFLGMKLYMEPKNSSYYRNVTEVNIDRDKDIRPSPKYVITLTLINGIVIGIFYALCSIYAMPALIPFIYASILIVLYVIELSRSISINENTIILSRMFMQDIAIPLAIIEGMYIYSYNKKFLKKHALTTKLVISASGKLYKYTISSLENKVILNMMKNNFGVSEYKMFIAKQ